MHFFSVLITGPITRFSTAIDADWELIKLIAHFQSVCFQINSFGSISLNSTTASDITAVRHNIIMAPFFVRSQQGLSGNVFYKQSLNDSDLFERISEDISAFESETEEGFIPTFALKVTWSNISSVNDSEKVGTSIQLNLSLDFNVFKVFTAFYCL